jgi:hypothetical protein
MSVKAGDHIWEPQCNNYEIVTPELICNNPECHSYGLSVCLCVCFTRFSQQTALFSPLKSLKIYGGKAACLQTGRKWILFKSSSKLNVSYSSCGRTIVDSLTRNPGFFTRSVHVTFVMGKVSIGLVFICGFFDFTLISIIPPLLWTPSLISVQPTPCNRIKRKLSNTLKSRFVSVLETLRDGPRFEDRLCLCIHWLWERRPSPSVGTTKDTFDRKFQFPFVSPSVYVTIQARRGYWASWRFGV